MEYWKYTNSPYTFLTRRKLCTECPPMPEALPLPPPKEDLKKNGTLAEDDYENESEEELSSVHLRHVKAEIEELAVIAINSNHRIMSGFPDHVLHTDCGKEMLTTISAQYVLAEKQGRSSEEGLKRALLAIAQDKGHVVSNLFAAYAERSNAIMQGVPIWKSTSTIDTANILIRKRDGKVDTRTVYRSAVQKLCETMANILGDHSYDFKKRVAMREAVVATHTAFGKELMRQAQSEEGSEGDA